MRRGHRLLRNPHLPISNTIEPYVRVVHYCKMLRAADNQPITLNLEPFDLVQGVNVYDVGRIIL
jgi:hypothetical protein